MLRVIARLASLHQRDDHLFEQLEAIGRHLVERKRHVVKPATHVHRIDRAKENLSACRRALTGPLWVAE